MAEDTLTTSGIGKHGVPRLPSVDIDSYNVELKDDDGFLGDRASKGAFRRILDDLRKPLRKNGDDPLGKTPSDEIAKGSLDEALVGDDIEAAALVHGAIEEFARELAYVTSRFLKTKAWADTECIVVGGGFRKSRVGEIAIGAGQSVAAGQTLGRLSADANGAPEVYLEVRKESAPVDPAVPNIQAIGDLLYTRYLFVFEGAGLVLLVAMIGAIVLTHRERAGSRYQNVARQVARRPGDATRNTRPPVGAGVSL